MGKLTPHEFQEMTGVSRETLDKLELYESLVKKWQGAINLVGPATLDDIWRRHFLDSSQLYPMVRDLGGALVDLGSGAGFPGLVLAVMGHPAVHLVESDQRKAVFLREAARTMGVRVSVHAKRIADVVIEDKVSAVTARALAPLDDLVEMAVLWIEEGATGFFLKGKNAADEIDRAIKKHPVDIVTVPSLTDSDACIVRVNFRRDFT